MNNFAYLDNSSTTKPCEAATRAVCTALEENWGNPSSLHIMGVNSEMAVSDARAAVARALGAHEKEIYFTSGGTEGDNLAIFGAARALEKRGKRIVTTEIEHHAVLEAVDALGESGFEIVKIKPDAFGNISPDDIKAAVNKDTILVSVMLVNNEVGSTLPVAACREAISAAGAPALLHCDAVQAFGKIPIDVKRLGVDMLTVSGHKVHAPKGVGALYVKNGVNIRPQLLGGGQEKGVRSGTEAVPAICGFGAAVGELPNLNAQLEKIRELRDYTENRLNAALDCVINSPADALPFVLNVSVLGYRSETLLHFLEGRGVYVSSGSACSKGAGSYVLRSMGLSRERVDSALRISFSRYSTKDDADALVAALVEAAGRLRKARI